MKNVIVTGANGYLGSEFIKLLLNRGVNVIALARNFDRVFISNTCLLTEIKIDDLTDVDTVASLIPIREYDAFFHFAWQGVNGAEKSDPLVQTENIKRAISCASIAKQVGARRFLCSGTIAERAIDCLQSLTKSSGGMIYSASKVAARLLLDTYCKNIGLAFVWMQFANIYGPGNRTGNLVSYTLQQLREGKTATFGPALQPYDFIFIDDLMEAVFRLGGEKKELDRFYYIGSGEHHILRDYLMMIGRISGKIDLIQIGVRPDDGIIYTWEMFDINPIIDRIGNYINHDFETGIRITIQQDILND